MQLLDVCLASIQKQPPSACGRATWSAQGAKRTYDKQLKCPERLRVRPGSKTGRAVATGPHAVVWQRIHCFHQIPCTIHTTTRASRARARCRPEGLREDGRCEARGEVFHAEAPVVGEQERVADAEPTQETQTLAEGLRLVLEEVRGGQTARNRDLREGGTEWR